MRPGARPGGLGAAVRRAGRRVGRRAARWVLPAPLRARLLAALGAARGRPSRDLPAGGPAASGRDGGPAAPGRHGGADGAGDGASNGEERPRRRTRALLAPQVALLTDVVVLPIRGGVPRTPAQALSAEIGGPVWPPGLADSELRFRSRGHVLDRMLPPAPAPGEVVPGPCVWGGHLRDHFGHLVAEHVGRLPWSGELWPDLPVLFTSRRAARAEDLLPFQRQVLDWFGIGPERVRIVQRPVLARSLWVVPQGETHLRGAPSAAYLDVLARHAARAGLPREPAELVYVGRLGMIGRLRGANPGEGYLAGLLAARGARIVDPAALPLRDQLAAYAGARRLVFAEGSAIHGRQLLGRLRQDIVVIKRRGKALGRTHLAPRCRRLTYVDAVRGLVEPVGPGRDLSAEALVFYDVPRLLGALAGLGMDLRAAWDPAAYRAACEADVAVWAAALRAGGHDLDAAATLAALDAALALRPFDA